MRSIALFALLFFKEPLSSLDHKTYRFIFVRGLFVIGQWVLLYYALTLGSAGIAVTLGNITPVFVLFLAFYFFEKISLEKALAAGAILAVSFTL